MGDQIFVEKKVVKEGAKDGRAWKRTGVKDAISGEWFSTFDEALAAKLAEGKRFDVVYESKPVNGRVMRDLKSVEPVEESPISSRTEEGEPDWDLIGLRKTRCALWAGLLGELAPSLYAAGKGDINHVIRNGIILVAAAEKDIFERAPGDDGFPSEPPGANGDIEI